MGESRESVVALLRNRVSFADSYSSALGPDQTIAVKRKSELLPLLAVVEAAQEKHRRTGFCPLCEAGPPPHHNDGCALAALTTEQKPPPIHFDPYHPPAHNEGEGK